jgi:hypothetical protein
MSPNPQQQQQHSLFLALPTELRLQIYSYLFPTGTIILMGNIDNPSHQYRKGVAPLSLSIPTGLLLVHSQIKLEIYSVLYGTNTFHFYIGHIHLHRSRYNDWLHRRIGSSFDEAGFGPRCEVVKWIRSVMLDVQSCNGREQAKSCRVTTCYLQAFVEAFRGNECRLEKLNVELSPNYIKRRVGGRRIVWIMKEGFDFILEPLAVLHGIKSVTFSEDVAFRDDLKAVMEGDGSRELTKVVYPTITFERGRGRERLLWRGRRRDWLIRSTIGTLSWAGQTRNVMLA